MDDTGIIAAILTIGKIMATPPDERSKRLIENDSKELIGLFLQTEQDLKYWLEHRGELGFSQ